MKKYKDFDELDQLFFDDVLEVMEKKYGGKPLELMETSTFFKRYERDPVYVQHHPPVYWADFIYEQHINRSQLEA